MMVTYKGFFVFCIATAVALGVAQQVATETPQKPFATSPSKLDSAPVGKYETTTQTVVHEKPSEKARKLGSIKPGTKVNVVKVLGNWLEIRSKHGRPPGFIRKNAAIPLGIISKGRYLQADFTPKRN